MEPVRSGSGTPQGSGGRARAPGTEVWFRLPVFLLLIGLLAGSRPSLPGPSSAECVVTGAAPERDIALATEACARAVERFTLLYGSTPPTGQIEVSDTVLFFSVVSNFPEWKFLWPTSRRMRDFFSEDGRAATAVEEALETQWRAVLPHEIAHLMLTAEVESRRPHGRAFRRLPDWLHEGTAVWMEPPAHRESDFAILRALRPYIPSVEEMLRIRIAHPPDGGEGGSIVIQTFYPCASEEACGGRPHWSRIFSVTTRQFPDGRIQVDTTLLDRPPPPPDPLAANFYPYAATLVRFIHHQGGVSAMSAVLDRYAQSADATVSLAGLPGLPRERGRVEEAWRAWFSEWIIGDQ